MLFDRLPGVMSILARNPVHSVLWLILASSTPPA
jgi:NADH:ubiquinone oxidoreductase subunit 6 (subunit J)